MTPADLDRLLDPAVQATLAEQAGLDPVAFSLQYGHRRDWPVAAMAEQLRCRTKAALKLPGLDGLLFTSRGLEQCSSAALARYHATLLANGTVADLTAGLGIDALHLARSNGRLDACERDPLLARILAHNLAASACHQAEAHARDGLEWLAGCHQRRDGLFLDPDRRADGQRHVALADCQPDLTRIWPDLCKKARKVLAKVSPGLDPAVVRSVLGPLHIQAVSWAGECRELLLMADDTAPPCTAAVILDDTGQERCRLEDRDPSNDEPAADLGGFLLIPDPAVRKLGFAGHLAARLGARRLAPASTWLIADRALAHPAVTCLAIIEVLPPGLHEAARHLRRAGITRAGLRRDRHPASVESLRQRLGVTAGGAEELLITRDQRGGNLILRCHPVAVSEPERPPP